MSAGAVSFSTLDEDRAGSSEPDDNLSAGPDDHFEMQLRAAVTSGFVPSVDGVVLAIPADSAWLRWEQLQSHDFVPEVSAEPGHFISADDIDATVASLDVVRRLDTNSPVALVRVTGRRFARVALSVTVVNPIALAQVGGNLAPAGVYAAAVALGQRQGMPVQRAWAALRSASSLLRPAAVWASTPGGSENVWPPPRIAEEQLAAAMRGLVSKQVLTEAAANNFLCAVHMSASAETDDAASRECGPASTLTPAQSAAREEQARRWVGWAKVAEALGENARALLYGADLQAAEPTDVLTNATVLRNALIKALGAPLAGTVDGAAAVPVRRWRRGAAQSAGPAGSASDSAIFEAITTGANTPFADLPTWAYRRYAAIPLEGPQ